MTHGRMLVGLAGRDIDVPLIRYAAMLTRLGAGHAPAHGSRRLAQEGTTTGAIHVDARAGAEGASRIPEVRFVHVRPRSGAAAPDCFRLFLREQVRRHFRALPWDVPVGCDVLKGCPVRRLATFAADFDSDLLLVGLSLCPPPLCGRLTMASPCPVWLVPPDWPPLVRRILVPVGMSPCDQAALSTAVHLARQFPSARVLPLHVHLEGVAISDEALHRHVQQRRRDEFEAFLANIDAAGVAVEPHLAVGIHVPEVIAAAAHRLSIDLIVLSTRGRSRLASMLLPSVADRTARHSSASILVLKHPEPPLGFFGALARKLRGPEFLRFS